MDSLESLSLDPGVLRKAPLLELFGWTAVESVGGIAVLPNRRMWTEALSAGVDAVALPENLGNHDFKQALVHLQKGRAATQSGLCAAWERLENGGLLLLEGGNELGIKSAVKRLAVELGQQPQILANRAHSRVALFEKAAGVGPMSPKVEPVIVEALGDSFSLRSAVGVFSADAVDPGSRLLLVHLEVVDPPGRILDPGCGLGVLGLAALRRWPSATAVLADVDRRAVRAAEGNAEDLGLSSRCSTVWWDATRENPPVQHCDLVLLNPPFHTGKAVDLDAPRAMFRAIAEVLEPGGQALIVANRTLPYEKDLDSIGRLRQVALRDGFKLLERRR